MGQLLFASLAAENARGFYQDLAGYLTRAVGVPVRLVEDVPWQERERWLHSGRAHIGVVCGLQYVLADTQLEVLAAPVMRAPRYLNRPVYFSDVVVRADSEIRRFDDLSGKRWVFNEPTSHSGHGVVCYALAERGVDWSFFSEVRESGTHERSLQWVLHGHADAAAIDSTVLETELDQRPELARQVRVIDTLGPSPIPPLVASRTVPQELRVRVQETLLAMPPTQQVARYQRVVDADYDPIRAMALRGGALRLTALRREHQRLVLAERGGLE